MIATAEGRQTDPDERSTARQVIAYHAITVVVLSCALNVAAAAQRPSYARVPGAGQRMPRILRIQGKPGTPPPPQFRPRGEGPHRGDWLRKYGSLPPDQMQKQLEQDKQFQALTPDNKERLRQGLERFNELPPEKKQRVLNRMELLEHMPPDQQKRAEGLFQQFRGLDGERRQLVIQQLRRLRALPPDQRSRVFDSEKFKSGFSGDEQQLIRGLNELGSQLPPPRGPGF